MKYLKKVSEITAENIHELDKYVGCYAKRFYASFVKEALFKVEGFRWSTKRNWPEIRVMDADENTWWWDLEDTIIISNESMILDCDFVGNVNDEQYKGFNPFANTNK